MKKDVVLSQKELEIMDVLWQQDKPLSRQDILALTPNRTWQPASIHVMLNALLKKEAIYVNGFVPSAKNYARAFSPSFTHEEYSLTRLKASAHINQEIIARLMADLIEETNDITFINHLEGLIQQKKETLLKMPQS